MSLHKINRLRHMKYLKHFRGFLCYINEKHDREMINKNYTHWIFNIDICNVFIIYNDFTVSLKYIILYNMKPYKTHYTDLFISKTIFNFETFHIFTAYSINLNASHQLTSLKYLNFLNISQNFKWDSFFDLLHTWVTNITKCNGDI